MRLLGIILLFITSTCMPTQAQVESDALCESVATPDLLRCASSRLAGADEKLNSVYREKLSRSGDLENNLREVQRSWIRFRDSYCDSIREESAGGNEADIEGNFCLAALTEDRIGELESAGSTDSDSDFFKAIRSLERAGYNRQELISKLASTPNDVHWNEYTGKNCEFIGKVSASEISACKARLNFERTY
ncbi:lysozyme inhibitor LprI family protein [Luteimonas abyssi]|uniref:lysozyme inhibitor LprI family protein n=1 Tax=Luteimonas abyssi TaxID=1247514 RepID=UPI0009E94DB2|nr:lysozyme inhibitor LprI family protein [Luteimonas abyssi]